MRKAWSQQEALPETGTEPESGSEMVSGQEVLIGDMDTHKDVEYQLSGKVSVGELKQINDNTGDRLISGICVI